MKDISFYSDVEAVLKSKYGFNDEEIEEVGLEVLDNFYGVNTPEETASSVAEDSEKVVDEEEVPECSKDMTEGWVVDGETYCSEECRRNDYTDEEYQAKYDSEDQDEAYWTQWY